MLNDAPHLVPNLLLSCAAFFALATVFRSMMAAHPGAVAMLILYGLGHAAGAGAVGAQTGRRCQGTTTQAERHRP